MTRRQALAGLWGLAALAVLPSAALVLAGDDPLTAAQNLIDAGHLDEAILRLRRITADDARNERAYILLGRACAMADRPAEALRAFREALRLNPADTYTRMLADILAQHPLEEHAAPAESRGGRHGPSRQEKAALAEREAFLSGQGAAPARSGRFRLVLDAGHGGGDSGGVAASGLREKDVTLDVVLRAAREVQAGGGDVAVFLTRLSDVPLPQAARAACADLYGADLFVSVHAPFLADGSASGLYAFAPADPGQGSDGLAGAVAAFENRLAGMSPGFPRAGAQGIEARVVARAGLAGRREMGRRYASALRQALGPGPFSGKGGTEGAGLTLLSSVTVPAVCLAVGFLSNAGDEAVLADAAKRGELASGLARALAGLVAATPS